MSTAPNWTLPLLCIVVIFLSGIVGFKLLVPQEIKQNLTKRTDHVQQFDKTVVISGSTDNNLTLKKEETVNILLDGSQEKISAVTLNLEYDPQVIQIKEIAPGEFFASPNVLEKNIDNKDGRVSYSIGTLSPEPKKGIVAILKITSLKRGDTSITFGEKTAAASLGKTTSVLKEAKIVNLKIE